MAENILNNGIETCREIKKNLEELNSARMNAEGAKVAAAQGEKAVKAKEKAVKDEITATVNKRRNEVEASFDNEISNLNQRTKAVKGEKGKDRDVQQARRIEHETADNREYERECLLEIRSVCKRNGIPSIFNTEFFYSVFLPRSFKQVMVFLLTAVVGLVGLPSLIALIFLKNAKTFVTVLVFCGFSVFFVGLYALIQQLVIGRNRDAFMEIMKIRRDIRLNLKEIKTISKKVQKDKDDSKYDLGVYDDEMAKIADEVADVSEKKKIALREFEAETKTAITEQINETNRVELEELRQFVVDRQNEEKEALGRAKELSLFVATNYEPFIGKSELTIENIDKMIAVMEAGKANTIAEGLVAIKQPMTEEPTLMVDTSTTAAVEEEKTTDEEKKD